MWEITTPIFGARKKLATIMNLCFTNLSSANLSVTTIIIPKWLILLVLSIQGVFPWSVPKVSRMIFDGALIYQISCWYIIGYDNWDVYPIYHDIEYDVLFWKISCKKHECKCVNWKNSGKNVWNKKLMVIWFPNFGWFHDFFDSKSSEPTSGGSRQFWTQGEGFGAKNGAMFFFKKVPSRQWMMENREGKAPLSLFLLFGTVDPKGV